MCILAIHTAVIIQAYIILLESRVEELGKSIKPEAERLLYKVSRSCDWKRGVPPICICPATLVAWTHSTNATAGEGHARAVVPYAKG